MVSRYVVLIPARNEERMIEKTINNVLNQSIKADIILVVNDGSTDNTNDIVRRMQSINPSIWIINRKNRGYSALGKKEMSVVYQDGFDVLFTQDDWKYLMVLGADASIPNNYVDSIIKRMGDNCAVAGGYLEGREKHPNHISGTGRIIRRSVLEELGGYPYSYCWESAILYYSREKGYKTTTFYDVVQRTQRGDGQGYRPDYVSWGRGMKDCGHYFLVAYGRIFKRFVKGHPRESIKMFWGYITYKTKEDDTWRKFNRQEQKDRVKRILGRFKIW